MEDSTITIEHVNIADPNNHEPKGVAAAAVNKVYISDGAGSGSWSGITADAVDTTGATVDQVFLADGSGGGSWEDSSDNVYGQMDILGNTTGLATTSAGDSTLNTDTDYSKITGIWTTPAGITNKGVVFSTDKLTVPTTGIYRIEFWGSFTSPNSSVTGIKFAINDVAPYSAAKMKRSSTSSTDYGVAAAHSFLSLTANDTVSLYYASTVTNATGIVLEDGVLMVQLVDAG